MDPLLWCSYVGMIFMAWTFSMYWLHRLSHIHSKYNPLWKIHTSHHKVPYIPFQGKVKMCWSQLIFWHGTWQATMDIYMVATAPIVILTIAFPSYGWPVLLFHFFYEVFLSGLALDHNIRITGPITRFFAWGNYHLYHHVELNKNYGLVITFWDYVFGSATMPADNFIEERIKHKQKTGKVPADFSFNDWPNGTIFGSDAG